MPCLIFPFPHFFLSPSIHHLTTIGFGDFFFVVITITLVIILLVNNDVLLLVPTESPGLQLGATQHIFPGGQHGRQTRALRGQGT